MVPTDDIETFSALVMLIREWAVEEDWAEIPLPDEKRRLDFEGSERGFNPTVSMPPTSRTRTELESF
jgi:hypothetical protein